MLTPRSSALVARRRLRLTRVSSLHGVIIILCRHRRLQDFEGKALELGSGSLHPLVVAAHGWDRLGALAVLPRGGGAVLVCDRRADGRRSAGSCSLCRCIAREGRALLPGGRRREAVAGADLSDAEWGRGGKALLLLRSVAPSCTAADRWFVWQKLQVLHEARAPVLLASALFRAAGRRRCRPSGSVPSRH